MLYAISRLRQLDIAISDRVYSFLICRKGNL
jgi:hypothetical protein